MDNLDVQLWVIHYSDQRKDTARVFFTFVPFSLWFYLYLQFHSLTPNLSLLLYSVYSQRFAINFALLCIADIHKHETYFLSF